MCEVPFVITIKQKQTQAAFGTPPKQKNEKNYRESEARGGSPMRLSPLNVHGQVLISHNDGKGNHLTPQQVRFALKLQKVRREREGLVPRARR